jgi:hypothetical protein
VTYSPRLAFLVETVALEVQHLLDTDGRLFAQAFSADRAAALRVDIDESERTDAFVARFGRLQDTVADKLLPEFLRCLAEPVGPAIDNLDRAEKLGLLNSADEWLASRKLRNRMVHQCVRDAAELAEALNQGHALVPFAGESCACHFGGLPPTRLAAAVTTR